MSERDEILAHALRSAENRLGQIRTYEDLVEFLRAWTSAGDPSVYDVVGMIGLFQACLENIQSNWIEADMETLRQELSPRERSLLQRMWESQGSS